MQQLQCNRSAPERSAPRRVELASGEIHRQPRGKLGSRAPHAAVLTGAEPWRIEGRTPSPCRPPVPPAGRRFTRAAAWTNRNPKNLLLRHILVRHTIRQREEECKTQTHRVRSHSSRFRGCHTVVTPNPSIERTRSGSAGLALISFWAYPAPPPRAAHVKR